MTQEESKKKYYLAELLRGTPLYAFKPEEVKEIIEYFPWVLDKKTEEQ